MYQFRSFVHRRFGSLEFAYNKKNSSDSLQCIFCVVLLLCQFCCFVPRFVCFACSFFPAEIDQTNILCVLCKIILIYDQLTCDRRWHCHNHRVASKGGTSIAILPAWTVFAARSQLIIIAVREFSSIPDNKTFYLASFTALAAAVVETKYSIIINRFLLCML